MTKARGPERPRAPLAGYSGKPLHQKLGLKAGSTCLTIGAPDAYAIWIAGAQGVRFTQAAQSAGIVHLFCTDRMSLERKISGALARVADGGALWVSWPKKSSTLFLDLTEDGLRDVILPLGWVDVKVCAVNADWSGLKFMRRRATVRPSKGQLS